MTIGRTLRRLRQECGLTQGELAERIGRIQPVIWRWEAGVVRIPAEELPGLAQALGISIARFFSEEAAHM